MRMHTFFAYTILISAGFLSVAFVVYGLFLTQHDSDPFVEVLRAPTYLHKARVAIAEVHDSDEAIRNYKKAVAYNSRDAEARYELAQAYIARGRYDEARTFLEDSLTTSNLESDVRIRMRTLLGIAYHGMGEDARAADIFIEDFSAGKPSWQNIQRYAWAQSVKGQYVVAEDILTEAIDTYGANAWLLSARAVARMGRATAEASESVRTTEQERARTDLSAAKKALGGVTADEFRREFLFANPNSFEAYKTHFIKVIDENMQKVRAGEGNGAAPLSGGLCGPYRCDSESNSCGKKASTIINTCRGEVCPAPVSPSCRQFGWHGMSDTECLWGSDSRQSIVLACRATETQRQMQSERIASKLQKGMHYSKRRVVKRQEYTGAVGSVR
jgi:hypothetical protein